MPGICLKKACSIFLLQMLCSCAVLGTGVAPIEDSPAGGLDLFPSSAQLSGLTPEQVCEFVPPAASKNTGSVVLRSDSFSRLAKTAMPAVVNLYVDTANEVGVQLLGVPLPGVPSIDLPGEALGSGFICSPRGFILSNAHVVAKAENLSARLLGGRIVALELIAVNHDRDLTLLRIAEPGPFPFLSLEDSASLNPGDWVMAIGNPLGINHFVSNGIISNSFIPPDANSLGTLPETAEATPSFVLSNTNVHPGSSGGPLISLRGSVVGITSAIVRNARSISISVPTEQARLFLEETTALSNR